MVVGSSEAARTAALVRGARPVASAAAAPSCTTALTRTSVTGSWGIGSDGAALCASGTSFSVTGAACAPRAEALRRALTPPRTNVEASIGRAISLLTVMPTFLHDRSSGPLASPGEDHPEGVVGGRRLDQVPGRRDREGQHGGGLGGDCLEVERRRGRRHRAAALTDVASAAPVGREQQAGLVRAEGQCGRAPGGEPADRHLDVE